MNNVRGLPAMKARRFMFTKDKELCTPATLVYPKKDRDGFLGVCFSIPRFVVEGKTFDETVETAKRTYHRYCMMAVLN